MWSCRVFVCLFVCFVCKWIWRYAILRRSYSPLRTHWSCRKRRPDTVYFIGTFHSRNVMGGAWWGERRRGKTRWCVCCEFKAGWVHRVSLSQITPARCVKERSGNVSALCLLVERRRFTEHTLWNPLTDGWSGVFFKPVGKTSVTLSARNMTDRERKKVLKRRATGNLAH